MGRYGRSTEAIARDLVVAFKHPDYADVRPLEALRDLRDRRLRGDPANE